LRVMAPPVRCSGLKPPIFTETRPDVIRRGGGPGCGLCRRLAVNKKIQRQANDDRRERPAKDSSSPDSGRVSVE